MQITAKVKHFLNPHLSFKRVPRFSSTVVASAFFKPIFEIPGMVKWPIYLWKMNLKVSVSLQR